MVLRRSDSAKTTLSMYVTRKTKYQRWLGIVNVLMLLGSLCVLFFGLVLKVTYYMDQLGQVTEVFVALPWLLMSVGIATFILASVGFFFSATEERKWVLVYAYLAVVLVVLQISTVFLATETRRQIDSKAFSKTTGSALKGYTESQAVRSKWDYLHTRLRCCGAWGHTDFTGFPADGYYKCVPDTCCWEYGKSGSVGDGCNPALDDRGTCRPEIELVKKIYVRGCLKILEQLYDEDLLALMLVYAVGGTLLFLVELVGVSLAFAFSAQINRRLNREREWGGGGSHDVTGGGGNLPMDDFPQDQ